MNALSKTLPECDDDTVELVLTPEQMRVLSLAAEEAELEIAEAEVVLEASRPESKAVVSTALTVVPRPQTTAAKRPVRRWHQTPVAKMAVNTLAFVAFAWWSVAQLAGQPQSRKNAVIRPAVAATPTAVALPSAPEPTPAPAALQVVNPFDSKEFFEFPAGTSDDEAREKVAEILMQRAHERQSKWQHIRTEGRLRTASLAANRKASGPGT